MRGLRFAFGLREGGNAGDHQGQVLELGPHHFVQEGRFRLAPPVAVNGGAGIAGVAFPYL
jgi:hypothetical protein